MWVSYFRKTYVAGLYSLTLYLAGGYYYLGVDLGVPAGGSVATTFYQCVKQCSSWNSQTNGTCIGADWTINTSSCMSLDASSGLLSGQIADPNHNMARLINSANPTITDNPSSSSGMSYLLSFLRYFASDHVSCIHVFHGVLHIIFPKAL